MKKELKIILSAEEYANKKGGVFEDMIRTVVSTEGYEISQNLNFAGLEIDLLANHKVRKHETLYVECKAKIKPASTEIKNFSFGVNHKDASHGYFIHTEELDHQAGALKKEIQDSNKEEYKKLSFIGPSEIIDILIRADFIEPLNLKQKSRKLTTKLVLALTYFGKYYVYILADNNLPTAFGIIDASSSKNAITDDTVKLLKENIRELKDLSYLPTSAPAKALVSTKTVKELDTISEVATGDRWYDYKPTNPNYFVGRDNLLKSTFDFFESVRNHSTDKRVFYLEGKSGWGKSSFIASIRERANKKTAKKYFVYAADYRSALSPNFASIAFSKMLEKAVLNGFVPKKLASANARITSAYDILDSDQIKTLLQYLRDENKVLILIFDQFEDAFRQGTMFDSFYKLLNDTHDVSANFIVGFSWKSEINIPVDHEAYYLWQQAKTNAIEMRVPEFGAKDIRAVIHQLETEIDTKLPTILKQKVSEISQGFPWLIKKLCIHIFEQVKSGVALEVLQEEDMNIEALFKQDLEKLSPKESSMLAFIARRAYDGNPFDISELDDGDDSIIKGLIDKRLVIKSGTKHNIYWDIFRDYLVEGRVPEIGETYFLRNQPEKTYKILKIIKDNDGVSINQIEKIDTKKLDHKTYQNFFRLLKDLNIISTDEIASKKSDDDKLYKVSVPSLSKLSEEKFKEFLREKFTKYAPILRLKKIGVGKKIPFETALSVFKDTFKGRAFNDRTWAIYTHLISNWFKYCKYPLEIGDSPRQQPLRSNKENDRFITNYPKQVIEYGLSLKNGTELELTDARRKKIHWDLKVLDLVDKSSDTVLKKDFMILEDSEFQNRVLIHASQLLPIAAVIKYLQDQRGYKIKAQDIVNNLPELFINAKSNSYQKVLASTLKSWALAIIENDSKNLVNRSD